MPLGGEVQNSKGAGDFDPFADGGGRTSALIDENQIGLELDAESKGSSFAGIEIVQGWIVGVANVNYA